MNPNHKPDITWIQLLECRHGSTSVHPCMAELDKQVSKDTQLPDGARPILPQGSKTGEAPTTEAKRIPADQVQNYQADLAVLLAKEGADIEQSICTAFEANLDITVEMTDKPNA